MRCFRTTATCMVGRGTRFRIVWRRSFGSGETHYEPWLFFVRSDLILFSVVRLGSVLFLWFRFVAAGRYLYKSLYFKNMLNKIIWGGVKISLSFSWLWDKFWAFFWKRSMKYCGRGVYLRPMSSDIKGLWNLSVGDGTSIPKGSTLYCTEAPLIIGRKVIFWNYRNKSS